MKNKKKIIISVTAIFLVIATIIMCVFAYIDRQNDIRRAKEEYEQAHNSQSTNTTTYTEYNPPENNVPPIKFPDDSDESDEKDDIILDVTDRERNPNPEVIDTKVEYGTKEGTDNAE